MKTADPVMPAAQESVVARLFRAAYQSFGQPAQLILITLVQLTKSPNQAKLDIRKLVPRRCSHFNVADIGVCAIQHAYHSIQCIPKAPLWGRVNGHLPGQKGLLPMFCYKLIRFCGSGIGQGFQVAANRPLVFLRKASVLVDQYILYLAQRVSGKRSSQTGQYVRDIKTKFARAFAQVGRRGVTRSRLPVRLRPFGDPKSFSNLKLRQSTSSPLLLKPRTYLFRKMHYFSSLLFTSALKCIIVHLTPHEIARICTMPNTSITEQARRQAREALEKRGQSAKDFAEQHQLNPSTVYAVLSGQSQCRRGEAHRAAVLLGIKDGVIEQ